MLMYLQFDCPTRNEAMRRAMEGYVGFLDKAFAQYWNLWEDYSKLKEEHNRCNTCLLSKMTTEEYRARTSGDTESRSQSRSRSISQDVNASLLELNISSQDFNSDMEAENLSEFHRDADSRSKSPVITGMYPSAGGVSAKKLLKSTKTIPLRNNSGTNAQTPNAKVAKEVSPKLSEKQVSTAHYVETTFLPDGKKLKQARLTFPVKHDERKLSLPNVDKVKAMSATRETGRNRTDNVSMALPTTIKNISEEEIFLEDVVEVSPTQDIKSKPKLRLKIKRRPLAQQTERKRSPDKYICLSPESKAVVKITVNDVDFKPLPSPESIQVKKEPLTKHSNVVDMLRDKSNTLDHLSVHKYSAVHVKNVESIDACKKNQLATNKVQDVTQAASNYDEETFYLPAEQAAYINDMDFASNNAENNPPAKRTLLDKFNVLMKRRENIPEQLNMRSKADRAKLNGWDCWECEEYYKNLSLPIEELQKRKNMCSRHRHKYERPTTPEGFWDPEFPDTLSSCDKI